MYKIIGADLREYGPVTADQLRQWISEGRINATTKLQALGEAGWKNASEFPEFAPMLPGTVAPPFGLTPGPVSMMPAPLAKTNQMAVWALVTGIISLITCCWFLGILPIILGWVALSQIKRNPMQQGSGFAIAGIVLGIISVLLMIIVAVIITSSPQIISGLPNLLTQ